MRKKLKIIVGNDIRRCNYQPPLTLEKLHNLVQSTFNLLDGYSVMYVDDEGDKVTIGAEEDVQEAVALAEEMNQKSLKIYIKGEVIHEHPSLDAEQSLEIPNYMREDSEEKKIEIEVAIEKPKFMILENAKDTLLAYYTVIMSDDTLREEFFAAIRQLINSLKLGVRDWNALVVEFFGKAPELMDVLDWQVIRESVLTIIECSGQLVGAEIEDHNPLVQMFRFYGAPIPQPFNFDTIGEVFEQFTLIEGLPDDLLAARQSVLENIIPKLSGIPQDFDASQSQLLQFGVACNHCGQSPIRGPRYQCQQCYDFDLCPECEALELHLPNHTFLKTRVSPEDLPQLPTFNFNREFPALFRAQSQVVVDVEEDLVEEPDVVEEKEDLAARFVGDVNLRDGDVVGSNQSIVKSWRMENNGKLAWPEATRLVYVEGDRGILWHGETEFIAPSAAPNETVEVNVVLYSNRPGVYNTTFQLMDRDGQHFGDILKLELVVFDQ